MTVCTQKLNQSLELAKETLQQEAQALLSLANSIQKPFLEATNLLLTCKGRVVVSGVGKSGHIGRKIAATLASTGTPAFFVHANEAAHGDLGMITKNDVVIGISNSGTTSELLTIIPILKREGIPLIAMTSKADSPLAKYADVFLDVGVSAEACPLKLAPTTSTTATLALGDALAVACLSFKGFTKEDFARSHPGGALGRQLLLHVKDVMRPLSVIPTVGPEVSVMEGIQACSGKHIGMVAITQPTGEVLGIFTEGDLRRLINRVGDVRNINMAEVMTTSPKSIHYNALAVEAARILEKGMCNQLLVVDDNNKLVGAIHLHDLMNAKVI